MKSEKVKKFIRDKQVYMLDPRFVGYREVKALGRNNSYRAVELAEQEAEERMRKKAEEAFFSCCHCVLPQYVRNKCETCEAYKSFIQKLNEE